MKKRDIQSNTNRSGIFSELLMSACHSSKTSTPDKQTTLEKAENKNTNKRAPPKITDRSWLSLAIIFEKYFSRQRKCLMLHTPQKHTLKDKSLILAETKLFNFLR
jgi:hypothetical protein